MEQVGQQVAEQLLLAAEQMGAAGNIDVHCDVESHGPASARAQGRCNGFDRGLAPSLTGDDGERYRQGSGDGQDFDPQVPAHDTQGGYWSVGAK